jgi:hypothetical protein
MDSRRETGVWAALGLLALGCGSTRSSAPTPAPRPVASPKAVTSAAIRITELSTGARRIEVPDQRQYWRNGGFVALDPTIRISQPSGSSSNIIVYFKAPEGIGAARVDGRLSLLLPPGSEADRVTFFRAGPKGQTVADVRGGRIDEQGRNWFHVFRPTSGAAHASLVGFEWLVDDPQQAREAKKLLMDHVRHTPRAMRKAVPDESYATRFSRLNDCKACHFPDKAPAADPDQWLPLWPTDRAGWYVPLGVLLTRAPLSTTSSFHDPNHDDPFVTKQCKSGPPNTLSDDATRWFRCSDGSVPFAERDVARALVEGDAYAVRLCRSRRYFYDRMTPQARALFGEAFAECEAAKKP